MGKAPEIEQRALLTEVQRADLLDIMHGLGAIESVGRVSVDFSAVEDRRLTAALRIDNGVLSLVAKAGALSADIRPSEDVRLDASVAPSAALRYMALMGHTDAQIMLRRLFVVRTADLEYSLRDVLRQDTGERVDTLLEIEACDVQPGQEAAALQRVQAAFAEHGLTPLGPDDFKAWVARTYQEVDRPFAYSEAAAAAFEQSLPTLQEYLSY